jgi:hypothetical protein
MNNKYDDFIKMFNDNVMILPDCEGRAVFVETDEGLDRNVMVSVDSVNPNEGMILIASFKIKNFVRECDRLHLDYMPMFLKFVSSIVRNYVDGLPMVINKRF